MREQGLKDVFDEEKDLFQGIKLMSDLLKKINEPFAKVWAKLTNSIILIEEDMRDILNNFNEFRQQTLNNPRTADEEKEDLLNNPYGRTMKGGNFTKRGGNTLLSELVKGYKDGKVGYQKRGGGYWNTGHYNTGVSMKGGAEMAKYDDTRMAKYDDTRMPKYDESRMGIYDNSRMGVDDNSRMGVYNAYSGGMPPQLSHPSSREMARYYGGGGSKYI